MLTGLKSFSLLIIFVLTCTVQPILADVSISKVTGSVTHGATLTIEGSGFGTKTQAAPWRWENFDTGTSSYLWNYPTVTSSSQRGQSSYHIIACNNDEYSGMAFAYGGLATAGTTVYASAWFWIPADFAWTAADDDIGNDQIKIMRSYNYSTPTDGTPNNYLAIRDDPYQTLMICEERGSLNGGDGTWYGSASNIIRGQWNRLEWSFKLSSTPTTADGWHLLYIDGKKIVSLENVLSLRSGYQSYTVEHDSLTMPNTCRPHDDGDRPHYDDIYVDFTIARVEISEQDEWDNTVRSHKEIQIPVTWQNGSVEVTINQGSFNTQDTAYLYIIDSAGNVNATGFPIVFGSSYDDVAPTVDTASIGTNGTTITLGFSESVTTTGYDNGDFDLVCSTAGTVALNSISGTGSSRTLTAVSTIYQDDTCTLSFDGATDEVQDLAGNDLADFTLKAVTNNSTAGGPDETPPTITASGPSGVQSCTSDPRSVTLTATTNETANCRYGARSAAWGAMSAMGTTGGTSHSQTVSSLDCGESFQYDILCQDAATNQSTAAQVDFSISAADDTTPPSVTISTADPSSVQVSSIAISGTASDTNGIVEVKYRIGSAPDNDNGTAITGTTDWSGTVVDLEIGANTVYVGAKDPSGNWGSDSIVVNYSLPVGDYITIGKNTGNTIFGGEETLVNVNPAGENFSTLNWAGVYIWPVNTAANHTIAKIDLSAVTGDIASAEYHVYVQEAGGATNPLNVTIHKITGADVTISTVTWTSFLTNTYGAAIDTLATTAETGWIVFDVTSMVREWKANPATNYGLVITANTGLSDSYRFFTTSLGADGNRPYLVIYGNTIPSMGTPSGAMIIN